MLKIEGNNHEYLSNDFIWIYQFNINSNLYFCFFQIEDIFFLRKLNHKNYKGFRLDGIAHQEDKIYEVKYSILNLFMLNNILIIKQKSRKYGNWINRIYIYENNPFIASGIYTYEEDGPNLWNMGNSTNTYK